jgi:ketosteroid isomerase-like protein
VAVSEENVEVIRRIYEASARRDSSAVLDNYHPEVVVDMSRAPCRHMVGGGVYHGHEGLRAFYRRWTEAWEVVDSVLEDLIDTGDRVITFETMRGRGRASGAAVELHECGIWTVSGGKVVRVDWLDAANKDDLRAAGLSDLVAAGRSE